MSQPTHVCTVCGYPNLASPPRAQNGAGSLEICPCCGFQFGLDDDDRGLTPTQAREQWLTAGAKWFSRGIRAPAGWDPHQQLAAAKLSGSPTPATTRPAPAAPAAPPASPRSRPRPRPLG